MSQPAKYTNLAVIDPKESGHNDSIMFKVRDTGAIGAPRTHIMIDENGREHPITFPNSFDSISVPYRYALKFAAIDGFVVLDGAGRQIKAVSTRRTMNFELKPNQVVATFDELKHEALVARAKQAGGNVSKQTKVEDLIAFLISTDGLRLSNGDTAFGEEMPQAAPAEGAADSELLSED